MGWLNFAAKKRSAAKGFGNSPKRKGRKKSRSQVLERIVTPSAGVAGWLDDLNPLHQLLSSLSLPDLHLPNIFADSGVCPIDPAAPTSNLPPLIDFDPLGLYRDGIATQSPYNPGGAFETLPIGIIPVDPQAPNPKDPNAIRQLLDFPATSQPYVGTIDTGVSADSPYLNYANIKKGRDYVGGDDNPLLNPGEGSEHGTFMLGIIDAINKTAPKWVGRAIDSGRWADSLVEFVDAAKASGQKNAIANLSLDLTQKNADGIVETRYELTPQERSAIEYARQNGVMLVVAAGNDGGVMSVLGQASQEFDNIFTVGAGDINGRSIYSSYGRGLDILADGGTSEHPGLSTVGNDLGTMAGTSVATAKVAGAASLVWAANPALNYRQVMEILKSTARDLGPSGWDDETGFGFLNTLAAVDLAKKTAPEVYEIPATVVPDTWSGQGKVTPSERAVNFNGRINNVGDVKVTGWLRIRSQPNTSSAEVAKITPGTQLEFLDGPVQGGMVTDTSGLGSSSTWYRLANNSGYMSALYIQNVGSIPAPTPTPAPKPTPTPTPAPAPKPTPTPTPAPAPKPTPTPTPAPAPKPIPQVPINSNSANYRNGAVNPFAYRWQGQCTWYAYGRMLETGLLPAAIKKNALFLGNAGLWRNDALKVGLPVTSTPTAGARGLVVWPPNTKGAGSVGHVAFLEEVYPDGRVRITEANWPTGSGIKERILTPAQYAGVSFVRLENAQTNSYNAPPAKPGQQRQYVVRSGDTLSAIALRELGNANRWTEIKKVDGSTFTAAEAQSIKPGQSVYLPVSYQTGPSKPITPTPSPINNQPTPIQFVDPTLTQDWIQHNDPDPNRNKYWSSLDSDAVFGSWSSLKSLQIGFQYEFPFGFKVVKAEDVAQGAENDLRNFFNTWNLPLADKHIEHFLNQGDSTGNPLHLGTPMDDIPVDELLQYVPGFQNVYNARINQVKSQLNQYSEQLKREGKRIKPGRYWINSASSQYDWTYVQKRVGADFGKRLNQGINLFDKLIDSVNGNLSAIANPSENVRKLLDFYNAIGRLEYNTSMQVIVHEDSTISLKTQMYVHDYFNFDIKLDEFPGQPQLKSDYWKKLGSWGLRFGQSAVPEILVNLGMANNYEQSGVSSVREFKV
ncbi:S8 family serine peptidase [Microcoleus sp. ARI1-B5]|uniref:S8 family serine peptidase n=1 Tax=unclassified Microcoleus TaxID=2642155 RepID=UPI002FD5485A